MRELIFYNSVGDAPFDAKSVRAALEAAGKADLHVRINSSGGNVFEALSIHDMLARHPGQVFVHVDGFALSAASVVAMAGRHIEMAQNGWLMIHSPVLSMVGTAEDLASAAEMVAKARDQLVGIYANRTGLSRERIGEMMAAETWMTATEAVALKFADSIAPVKHVAASVDLSTTFKNIPLHLKGKAMSEPTTIADLRAACPGAPADFLLKQLEAGADAATAKAAWLTEREQNLAARERAANARAPGVEALGSGRGQRSASAAGDEAEQFRDLVTSEIAKGVPQLQAVARVARKHPDLHREFVLTNNAGHVHSAIEARFMQ